VRSLRGHVISSPQFALRMLALATKCKARRDHHTLALARLEASERIAASVVAIYDRLRLASLIVRPTFNLPLMQDQGYQR
jgi:hypothetical protein